MEVHSSTGLQYLRNRYYDMETGRFISRDPLSAMPGWVEHPYMYASANPVNFVDPGGLAPVPDAELREYERECLAGPSWSCYWYPGFWSSSPNPAPASTPEPSSNEPRPTPEAEPLIPDGPKMHREDTISPWRLVTDLVVVPGCVWYYAKFKLPNPLCDLFIPPAQEFRDDTIAMPLFDGVSSPLWDALLPSLVREK